MWKVYPIDGRFSQSTQGIHPLFHPALNCFRCFSRAWVSSFIAHTIRTQNERHRGHAWCVPNEQNSTSAQRRCRTSLAYCTHATHRATGLPEDTDLRGEIPEINSSAAVLIARVRIDKELQRARRCRCLPRLRFRGRKRCDQAQTPTPNLRFRGRKRCGFARDPDTYVRAKPGNYSGRYNRVLRHVRAFKPHGSVQGLSSLAVISGDDGAQPGSWPVSKQRPQK